jgi:hypothetical protein
MPSKLESEPLIQRFLEFEIFLVISDDTFAISDPTRLLRIAALLTR